MSSSSTASGSSGCVFSRIASCILQHLHFRKAYPFLTAMYLGKLFFRFVSRFLKNIFRSSLDSRYVLKFADFPIYRKSPVHRHTTCGRDFLLYRKKYSGNFYIDVAHKTEKGRIAIHNCQREKSIPTNRKGGMLRSRLEEFLMKFNPHESIISCNAIQKDSIISFPPRPMPEREKFL